MKHCAFLSMDPTELEEYFVYDELLYAPLKQRGWQVSDVPWRDGTTDWGQFDAVVVRSTWDYQQDPQAFFACLQNIQASGVPLYNTLSLMQWNLDKRYLADLSQKGVDIVPTLWMRGFDADEIQRAFSVLKATTLVIKPTISANADDTHRITMESLPLNYEDFAKTYAERDVMIQPFVTAVVDEGEYSLFYFDGAFSHGICKRPAKDDFRVQEEHGGRLMAIDPPAAMLEAAENVLKALPESSLYARVDLVQFQQRYSLMEVELIEPSLYFNMDNASANRFAEAFVQCVARHQAR